MLGYIILGTLAAFGLLCWLWGLFGWLLPGGKGNVILFLCGQGRNEDWALTRYDCLRGLGLVKGPLLIIGSTLSAREQERIQRWHRGVEFCSLEELVPRLEQEREQLG